MSRRGAGGRGAGSRDAGGRGPGSPGVGTATVRAGVGACEVHGDVIPPLHLSTNYTFEGLGAPRRFDYTRSGNPTRAVLEEALAEAEGGVGCVVTSSGMSAVAVALHLCPPGGRILAPEDCYGGTHRLLAGWEARGLFRVEWTDYLDLEAVETCLREGVDLMWVETPSNPLLRVTDVAAVAERAKASGATVVVDNTFLSPALQNPIRLGADVVVHSTTKYVNGHSDVVGGAVISARSETAERVQWWANAIGVTGSPFDAYQTLRGLRTLHVRIARHEENALRVVEALRAHPAVRRVYHPSLSAHPGHATASRQQSGWGSCVSFELDSADVVEPCVAALKCFSLAESLGGVESLVCHPATMTHASMPEQARLRAGISDTLLRLSVGIECGEDLVSDLERALNRTLEPVGV